MPNISLITKNEMTHLQGKISDICSRKNISSKELSDNLGIPVADVKKIKLGKMDVSPSQYTTLKTLFKNKGIFPVDNLLVGPLPEESGFPRFCYYLFIKGMNITDFEKATGVAFFEMKKLFKSGSIYSVKNNLLKIFSKKEYEEISGFNFLQLEFDNEILRHLTVTTLLNLYLDKGNKTMDQVMKDTNCSLTMINELFTKGYVSEDKNENILKRTCKSLEMNTELINNTLFAGLDNYLSYFIAREVYNKGSNLYDVAINTGIGYKNFMKKLERPESFNEGEIKDIFHHISSIFNYDPVEVIALSKKKFNNKSLVSSIHVKSNSYKIDYSKKSKRLKKFSPLKEFFNEKLSEHNLTYADLERTYDGKGFAAALNNSYIPKKMLPALELLEIDEPDVIHLIPEKRFKDWIHEYYGTTDDEDVKEGPVSEIDANINELAENGEYIESEYLELKEEKEKLAEENSENTAEEDVEEDSPNCLEAPESIETPVEVAEEDEPIPELIDSTNSTPDCYLDKIDVKMFFETFNKLSDLEQLNFIKCMMNAQGKDPEKLINEDFFGNSVLAKLFRYNIVYNIILRRDDK